MPVFFNLAMPHPTAYHFRLLTEKKIASLSYSLSICPSRHLRGKAVSNPMQKLVNGGCIEDMKILTYPGIEFNYYLGLGPSYTM